MGGSVIAGADSVAFVLPDRSNVLVALELEKLLREILDQRMVQNIVKYVPMEACGNVYHYLFSLNQLHRPIRKVTDCPLDTRVLLLSPVRKVTIDQAGFDPVHSYITHSQGLIPVSALFTRLNTATKLPRKANSGSYSLSNLHPVSTAVLGRVDMPPFQPNIVMSHTLSREIARSKPWSSARQTSAELQKNGDMTASMLTMKPGMESEQGGRRKNMNGWKVTEGNAGFRRPQHSPILHVQRTPGIFDTFSGRSSTMSTLKLDTTTKKTLLHLSDSILKQLDVESLCIRHSLTDKGFTKLVEEFVLLAGGTDTVPVTAICGYYKVNREAMRGINPDFDGEFAASMTWEEFVLFYSLAVSQRAQIFDLLTYLLTVFST